MGAHYDTFQQRQEVEFLGTATSLRETKDADLIKRLRDALAEKEKQTDQQWVIGEWYSHAGFGYAVIGHGWYPLNVASELFKKYGNPNCDPSFGFSPMDYLDKKLRRLSNT